MKFSKLLFAVVGATVLLGAFVSSASARNLSNSTQSIEATWTVMRFAGAFGTVECEVTLRGTLHSRTIQKVSGSLIGYITDARVRSPGCRRGEATILSETLPWHVQYDSFTGALPSISTITTRVIGSAFRAGLFGISCLSRSSAAEPSTGIYNREAGGRITSVTVGGAIRTTCGERGTLSGTSATNSAMTVTLI